MVRVTAQIVDDIKEIEITVKSENKKYTEMLERYLLDRYLKETLSSDKAQQLFEELKKQEKGNKKS